MSEFTNKDVQKYAWDYFALHASQRMSLFNFFVIFSSLVTTGLVGAFQETFRVYPLGFGFGVLLVLISFIFWKLDQRVEFLIKHAEAALKHIESQFPGEGMPGAPYVTQLFTLEEYLTNQKRKGYYLPWRWHMTYSRCFKVAYIAFALIGIVGAFISLILWIK